MHDSVRKWASGCALAVIVAVAAYPAGSSASDGTGVMACQSSLKSLRLTASDKLFASYTRQLTAYFAPVRAAGTIGRHTAPLVDARTQVLRVDVDTAACGATSGDGYDPASIGGCNYIGCTGQLGAEFDTLPSGSTVSISSCGGGIQRAGAFVKQGNGTWMMTAYREEMVANCEAM